MNLISLIITSSAPVTKSISTFHSQAPLYGTPSSHNLNVFTPW